MWRSPGHFLLTAQYQPTLNPITVFTDHNRPCEKIILHDTPSYHWF